MPEGAPMTPEQIAARPRAKPLTADETASLRQLVGYDAKGDALVDLVRAERNATLALLAHIDTLMAAVRDALTSEDQIAHGEAVRGGNTRDPKSYEGIGVCAYCDGHWPCRTQRAIDRLLAILNGEHR